MTSVTPSPKRRGAPLVARILEAALAEIALVGHEKLSVEDVARRASVNKTTIYRRWPDAEALALAAYEHGSANEPVPDTGHLRSDIIAYLKQFRGVCRTPAMRVLARIQFSGSADGAVGAMLASRLDGACDGRLMFERAIARGDLPQTVDSGLLRDLVVGGAQYLLLFRHDPLEDERLEQIVDTLLGGALCQRAVLPFKD